MSNLVKSVKSTLTKKMILKEMNELYLEEAARVRYCYENGKMSKKAGIIRMLCIETVIASLKKEWEL